MPEVEKKGDWYRVRGTDSAGRAQSVDIPAPSVEKLSRKEAEALFRRSIERIGDARGN